MKTLSIEPAFVVDSQGHISDGPISIFVPLSCPISRLKIPNQVIMPSFVNTHSHVFQRLLRGMAEKSRGEHNFWGWRELMYRLANALCPNDLFVIAQFVYGEMLEAGFCHVGEFHYLHHDHKGKPFKKPLAMSQALVDAAKATSMQLTLLLSAYHQSNFGHAALHEQQRFIFASAADFCAFAEEAHATFNDPLIHVGLSLHSVRAVPENWFAPILALAKEQKSVLHIHASEQEKEVKDCLNATGLSPIGLLAKHGLLTPTTTLIHATQLIEGDLELLKRHNPLISLCPSTEANLGDGLVPLKDLNEQKLRLCVGTDQHVRFDPFHEVYALEAHERLRLKERAILNRQGDWLYKKLLPILTTNGLASLFGQTFSPAPNDLIGVELPPEYEWHGREAALEAIFLGAYPQQIKTVFSGGELVVHEGHSLQKNKVLLKKEIAKIMSCINSIER